MGRGRQYVQLLVGISGIDGSGKSTIAPRVVDRLNLVWLKTELIRLDGWHNPPEVRFNRHRKRDARAGPGGIHVIAPDGTLLGTIVLGTATGNCAWGGDGSYLYIASDTAIYRIKTSTKGNGF